MNLNNEINLDAFFFLNRHTFSSFLSFVRIVAIILKLFGRSMWFICGENGNFLNFFFKSSWEIVVFTQHELQKKIFSIKFHFIACAEGKKNWKWMN